MNANQQRKMEKFEREDVFMTDNAADFPSASPGGKASGALADVIEEIRTLAANQISGTDTSRQQISVKDEDMDSLLFQIRQMNRAANAFEVEIPGSEMLFRLPRSRSEQNILATARSFHKDATPIAATFIDYGLAATFLADLQATIDAVETRAAQADSAMGQQSAATGGLVDATARGMNISRRLDAIVRIKYAANSAKLAAWTVASHLERHTPVPRTPVIPPTNGEEI